MKITNREFDYLMDELIERLKDIAYGRAGDTIRNSFTKEEVENMLDIAPSSACDRIDLVVKASLTSGDLRQIIARKRRTSP